MRVDGVGAREPSISWIHLTSGAFIVLWLTVGVASFLATSTPSIIKVGILGAWLVGAFARSSHYTSTFILRGWPLIVMLVVAVLFGSEIEFGAQYVQGLGYMLMAFALFCFYIQPTFERERNILLGIMAVDLVITGARTFLALQTDPRLSKYLATTESNRREVYGDRSFEGLGGYPFAYSLAAILLVLLYFAIRGRRHRAPLVLAFLAGLVVQFELAFTTAIVLVVALSAIMLVHALLPRLEFRVFAYVVLILGWAGGLYSWSLTTLSTEQWLSPDVAVRLNELAVFLDGGPLKGSDLGLRLSFWEQSITAVMSNGPLGVAGGGPAAVSAGKHSEWLDLIANYGILSVFMFLFLFSAWKECNSRMPAGALTHAWILFMMVGAINTIIFSTSALAWMLFLPSLVIFLTAWTKSSLIVKEQPSLSIKERSLP